MDEPGAFGRALALQHAAGGGNNIAFRVGNAYPCIVAISAFGAFQAFAQIVAVQRRANVGGGLSQQHDFAITFLQIGGDSLGDVVRQRMHGFALVLHDAVAQHVVQG